MGVATSLRYVAEVPYSPPSDKPCSSRAATSRIGANAPICAYPGKTAMPREPTPIKVTDSVSDARRPNRSAYRPKIHPPRGRTRKPTAKMPAVFSSCAVWFPEGKNTLAK